MASGGRIERANRPRPLRLGRVRARRGKRLTSPLIVRAKGRGIPAFFAWVAAICTLFGLGACSERFDWREYRSPDGFVVAFPARWQTVNRDVDLAGIKVPMTMTSTGIGSSVFAAGVARLPPSSTSSPDGVEKVAAFLADGLVRNIGATQGVRSMVAVPRTAGRPAAPGYAMALTASGRAGRENRPVELAARIVIVDDRAIQVVAIAAPGEVPAEALETFFTSFRLVP